MVYNESKYNKNWKTMKLSDLGEFARGKSTHRPRNDKNLFEGGGYPLVQTGEIKEANLYITHHTQEYGEFGLQQSKLWDAETLCITIAANIAETALLAYPMCFPDSVVGFKAYKEVSSEKFMYYVFDFIRNSIQNAASGSTQDNINIDYLTSLDFKVPDKIAQDKMVELLSAIDEKNLMNSKINDNLAYQLKDIYNYWFNQFDFPHNDKHQYKADGGLMIWNDKIKRKIPAGWEIKSFGELCSLRNGINYDKSVEGDKMYRIINVRNISSSDLILNENDLDEISLPQKQGNKYCVSENSIIVARSGIPGATRILQKPSSNIIFCGFIICCTPCDDIYKYYLMFYLKQLEGSAATKTGGSILQNVSQDTLSNLPVPIPPQSLLREFNQIVSQSLELIHSNMQENTQLLKLRDWLLPMLMNGQATISD